MWRCPAHRARKDSVAADDDAFKPSYIGGAMIFGGRLNAASPETPGCVVLCGVFVWFRGTSCARVCTGGRGGTCHVVVLRLDPGIFLAGRRTTGVLLTSTTRPLCAFALGCAATSTSILHLHTMLTSALALRRTSEMRNNVRSAVLIRRRTSPCCVRKTACILRGGECVRPP